jgi:segregation and condensation protein B
METKIIEKKIESILFWKAEPVKISDLAKILEISVEQVTEAAASLNSSLENRGIGLLNNNNELSLITAAENGPLIEKLLKEELNKELSKAALETLSIILYKGPMKRSEIDYIRGVNSQFIIRNLMIRGLVDKEQNPNDERGFFYKASADLLNFMGIKSVTEMPEYEKVRTDIDNFMNSNEEAKPETVNPETDVVPEFVDDSTETNSETDDIVGENNSTKNNNA